jgi:nucleoid DNA-binding protein
MANKNDKTSKVKYPEKFTASTISDFISNKYELPKKLAREIIEDLFDVIGNGVLKGERVPVGKFGKMYIRLKPATKPRIGRNPITGEEIQIPAKKATKVPKFVFAKSFKEEAFKAKVKK